MKYRIYYHEHALSSAQLKSILLSGANVEVDGHAYGGVKYLLIMPESDMSEC